MSRAVKDLYVASVATALRDVSSCLVVSLEGLDAEQTGQLRADLRSRSVDVLVIQNRLSRIALGNIGLGPVGDLLSGQCALAWGGETVVELAKVIQKWADELEPLVVRGGYAGGRIIGREDVEALSKMPSREELLGRIAGQLTASAARVVSLATAPAAGLLGQIRQIAGKDGDGGGEAEAA